MKTKLDFIRDKLDKSENSGFTNYNKEQILKESKSLLKKNKKNKMISIIVAKSKNNAIGRNNQLLWHLPEDLKRFKELTTDKVIIMGQKTFESLPIKPLPNRINIVITDDKKFKHDGVLKSYSIKAAINRAKKIAKKDGEIFVIGGGSIYKQFIDIVDKLYITEINAVFEDADVFFPEMDENDWTLDYQSEYILRPNYEFCYKVYSRKWF